MELKEIYEKLCTLDIPVAYLKFDKPQKLPFIAYFESGTEIQGADNYNLYRRTEIRVELYSENKNPDLERKIENLFRSVEIEKDGKRVAKIGGISNDNGKRYIIRGICHDKMDGDIRITGVGVNTSSWEAVFKTDSETVIQPTFELEPVLDDVGTLLIYKEEAIETQED